VALLRLLPLLVYIRHRSSRGGAVAGGLVLVELSALSGGTLSQRAVGKLYLRLIP
jgi:hypothetical protein